MASRSSARARRQRAETLGAEGFGTESRGGAGQSGQHGRVDEEVEVRLRPTVAAGTIGVDRNQRSAARAAPGAVEDARQGSVGLTDRSTGPIRSD
jgi:hypothetical protein